MKSPSLLFFNQGGIRIVQNPTTSPPNLLHTDVFPTEDGYLTAESFRDNQQIVLQLQKGAKNRFELWISLYTDFNLVYRFPLRKRVEITLPLQLGVQFRIAVNDSEILKIKIQG